MTTVAALFVQSNGTYYDLEGVDPWDLARDAREYDGPWPVVAHPPCERWGRYWHGGPSARVRRVKGDDGGCFAAALAAVRRWGGVLEHPEASAAWSAFGLTAPPKSGAGSRLATSSAGRAASSKATTGTAHARRRGCMRRTCRRCRPCGGVGPRQPFVSTLASTAPRSGAAPFAPARAQRMGKRERAATPIPFRDALIAMARTARVAQEVA